MSIMKNKEKRLKTKWWSTNENNQCTKRVQTSLWVLWATISVLLCVMIIILGSCAPSFNKLKQERLRQFETERERYISEHPEWTQSTVDYINKGKVSIGFTKDMVKAASFHPSMINTSIKINTTTTEHGVREQWVYHNFKNNRNTMYVYFNDGIVTSIQRF